ncbi:MAG: 30S ribosomal protein S21 [Spirochaetota bacterium]|nr:30S ribosomal protein S21 [Spirochaetota bacterium]
MTKIDVGNDEPIEIAIRRFRKKCERDGINRELKKRSFYEKPSLRKKRKKETLVRKLQKRMRRQRQQSKPL